MRCKTRAPRGPSGGGQKVKFGFMEDLAGGEVLRRWKKDFVGNVCIPGPCFAAKIYLNIRVVSCVM